MNEGKTTDFNVRAKSLPRKILKIRSSWRLRGLVRQVRDLAKLVEDHVCTKRRGRLVILLINITYCDRYVRAHQTSFFPSISFMSFCLFH